MEILAKIYPHCRSILSPAEWDRLVGSFRENQKPENFQKTVKGTMRELRLPGFLPELAHLEWAVYQTKVSDTQIPLNVDSPALNPTLQLQSVSWKHLVSLLNTRKSSDAVRPEKGEEVVAIWRVPQTNEVKAESASNEDLLVLKMVVEGIDPDEVATAAGVHLAAIDAAVYRAGKKGFLLTPSSSIRRDPLSFPKGQVADDQFFSAPVYPHVFELYGAAADRGFILSILGNPAPREQIERLLEIQRPSHFQVSLEGLPEHNDAIRGQGHFESIMAFLEILRDIEIPSVVMLTLTKDNIDQVLPLAERLRGRTDVFSFNRLSRVGEGMQLELPSPENYKEFLRAYMQESETNPALSLKDNLFGILLHQRDLPLSGGCTGYGCGAAFNFLALLPDGEVHACRKFPSLIGNIYEQSIGEIYDSEIARRYRNGTNACRSCAIRPVCGGCLAIAHSYGLNIFEDRDPFCFMEEPASLLMDS